MRSLKIDLFVGWREVAGDLVKDMDRPTKPSMCLAMVSSLESNLAQAVRQPPTCFDHTGIVRSPKGGGDLPPEFGVVEPMLQNDLSDGTGTLQLHNESSPMSSGISEPAELRENGRRLFDLGPEQVHFDLNPRQIFPVMSPEQYVFRPL